jgi:sulfur transfer complex TusBCD TusB component (DsrH family)
VLNTIFKQLTKNIMKSKSNTHKHNPFATELYILQAELIARNLVENHSRLLGKSETAVLFWFLYHSDTHQKRQADCIKILNIGKLVNRKLAKQKLMREQGIWQKSALKKIKQRKKK